MDTDIRDEIDRSFDDGPPIDDLDLLLDRGRAVVRRRRIAEGASLLLVAGVVTGVALLSTGGTTESSPPDPAGTPSASVTPSSPPVVPDSEADLVTVIDDPAPSSDRDVSLESDGFVHVAKGVEVLRTIPNPYPNSDGNLSAAVEYVSGGTTYWYVGLDDGAGRVSESRPTRARDGISFEDWVAERHFNVGHAEFTVLVVDPRVDPFEAVDLRGDGNIYVSPDVEVTRLDQHPWPEPEGSWAVALVYEQGGETHWFAGRQTGTNGTAASTTAIPGRTFQDWVAEQRDALLQGGGA